MGVITKTVYNHSKIVARPKITSPTAVGSAQFVSKIEAIKKQEDLKKEAIKKKAEIQKQKQELLLKQIEQQKVKAVYFLYIALKKEKLSFYTAVEVWAYYGIPCLFICSSTITNDIARNFYSALEFLFSLLVLQSHGTLL